MSEMVLQFSSLMWSSRSPFLSKSDCFASLRNDEYEKQHTLDDRLKKCRDVGQIHHIIHCPEDRRANDGSHNASDAPGEVDPTQCCSRYRLNPE